MDSPTRLSPFAPELPAKAGERLGWSRLYGSSKALAIAEAARRAAGPLIVVTPDSLSANRLEEEVRYFLGSSGETFGVLGFPDWETLPYDQFSPYQDIISERLNTLARLPTLGRGMLVVPVRTLMHRLAPQAYVQANSLLLRVGERLDLDGLRRRLESCGYRCVGEVMEHGDFAVRGSLLDVFPMGSDRPYRIDLFDEEIDSIRVFDPETQRSEDRSEAIDVLPAREFPLDHDAIARFRSAWRSRFEGKPTNSPIYNDVSQGLSPAGIEYYLPLFFDATSTLFDYLPGHATVVLDEGVNKAAEAFWHEVRERFEEGRHDIERPLLEPGEVFIQANELFGMVRRYPSVSILGIAEQAPTGVLEYDTAAPVQMPIDARAAEPLAVVNRFLASFDGRVLFVAESSGRRETLLELFRRNSLQPLVCDDWREFVDGDAALALTVAPLELGMQLGEPRIAVIGESQLFGERAMQRRLRKREPRDSEAVIRNLTELSEGSPVVHEQHGVGRYRGLVTLTVDEMPAEFIFLEYADGDKLYVPVSSLHLISRYAGVDPEHAPLHKLGSGHWQRARAKAAARVRDVAAELLEIYARRAARVGHQFRQDDEAYRAFQQGFPFEETPDQLTAIEAVIKDMVSRQPMDRLVCGDVGFGKTEVAMRAAFLAVNDGRQVAVLVPTTLLTQQHYQNFKDRFADWPVRIEQLSRFRGRKEQDAVIDGLREGTVDIVIGTHKLIQEGISFKRLGLLIIDEEHRFGVRQKEKLKALRADVDILTLTATPIPRTLNLALSGGRDLSIIATPPSRRLAIKTFVREWSDSLLREALLREIGRGGQVYFLHNDVESIEKMAKTVEALVPEARVHFAHGQMREKELERVMLDFYHRRFNILVCTTIIETGIDVPSANTIIINRADRFGLAQLYQLRGRVGRSHHRAYAYLLVPSRKAITADAVKRLEAIESLEELGVGFTLATHDLEIRGAGEILGEEQSGHIQEIGFGMYTEMLERAIADLKAGRQPELDRPLDHGAEIDLHIASLLPEDYVPDVHTRLILYKRVASAAGPEELRDLKAELIDRFGLLPEPARNLFRIAELKLRASPLGIRKVDMGLEGGRLHFDAEPKVDPMAVVQLIQSQPRTYRLESSDKLRIVKSMPEPESRIEALDALLDKLETKVAA